MCTHWWCSWSSCWSGVEPGGLYAVPLLTERDLEASWNMFLVTVCQIKLTTLSSSVHVCPLTSTVAIYGYSYKLKCPVPDRVRPSFVIFSHPGTLTLSPERQSAQMWKITNDGLIRSGTGCFIAVPIGLWQQCGVKGLNSRIVSYIVSFLMINRTVRDWEW